MITDHCLYIIITCEILVEPGSGYFLGFLDSVCPQLLQMPAPWSKFATTIALAEITRMI